MKTLGPDEILAESFRIIDREVGSHDYTPCEWPVVRRMIHASGDLELARCVRFRQDAVEEGVHALREGVPIVTDVRMVAAGINRALRQRYGVELHSWIDDAAVAEQAARTGRTRSACAIEKAIQEMGNAIYVIGSAPTALFTLIEAVRAGAVRPRLLLAMPVGFVSVMESKREALMLDVPLIVVEGRKGGSAIAAAAINALLHLAHESEAL
jgi:precorrin-8X/cobalt-precorrin-8 methylmutase